ncbi:MAG TPA: dephospho-CoA kinase [Candidatus Binatia bacterium]|nr:dephospho-CoA kinase [Candidatus Binatia bacterium]
MIVIGLTGGVGMGKSTSASILARRGLSVIDTDELARELVRPGKPALVEISKVFGPGMIDRAGELRRGEVAKIVFNDPAKRKQLERILHPRIRERWLVQLDQLRSEGHGAVVVVIPLLFETDAAKHFSHILCVACSAATQRVRLAARGWSEQAIDQRIASQSPIERKISASNFVVWTEGSLDIHEQQVDRVLKTLGLL